MRRDLQRILSIFPFEEEYFARHGIQATYIGHPLTRSLKPTLTRDEFFRKHGLDASKPLVTLLPGSRVGEVARHLPAVVAAAEILKLRTEANVILATPVQFAARAGSSFFQERIGGSSIQIVEGETSDALAHADVAIAASGTVTIEAAILGTPMVTFYKVTALSWALGRYLVRVPYYSMVNLVAGRKVVAELMQDEATGERLAAEALQLLENPASRAEMKRSLGGSNVEASSAGASDGACGAYCRRVFEAAGDAEDLRSRYMGRLVRPIAGYGNFCGCADLRRMPSRIDAFASTCSITSLTRRSIPKHKPSPRQPRFVLYRRTPRPPCRSN